MRPTDALTQVAAVSSHLKSQPAFGVGPTAIGPGVIEPAVIEPTVIQPPAIVTGKLPERKGSMGAAVSATPVHG